ncbi:MAG: hypothetical protein ACI8TQ_000132 [Planctomycetota bacterium]|jgi:hypothetical protein
MKFSFRASLRAVPFVVLAATPTFGQANANPAIDVELGAMSTLTQLGRTGTFPNGVNGITMRTTSCNKGSVVVPWEQAMDPDHPSIAFIVARDDGVRFQQISNRSYLKHGFFALQQNLCDTCQGGTPQGDFLGLGCSDTYTQNTNGNRFWLGPADEVNPWTGDWDPVGSYFDTGDPAVGGGAASDGVRSLDQSQVNQFSGDKNRVEVKDVSLLETGSERFYYQAQYVVAQELESLRDNNTGWREVNPNFSGGSWSFANVTSMALGSVLDGWSGASVTSNTNGSDDGRVFVAVKVTGPTDGLYHYEYAVHNRDNSRGIANFTLPICSESTVSNIGFSDVDRFSATDWIGTTNGTELTWSTTSNPLNWNSIYSFWFDSDAAPVDGVNISLDQFVPGAGADSVTISTRVPMANHNYETGPGCSNGVVPRLFAAGTTAQATIGNLGFKVQALDVAPSTPTIFLFTPFNGTVDVGGGCNLYMGTQNILFRVRISDGTGRANLNLPIPNDMALEGANVNFQLMELDPLGGPFSTDFDLSNGLRVRIGDQLPSCP